MKFILDCRVLSTLPETVEKSPKSQEATEEQRSSIRDNASNPKLAYRHIYPEFLPDPNPKWRNSLREKLERADMLKRRNQIDIPEFYVGK